MKQWRKKKKRQTINRVISIGWVYSKNDAFFTITITTTERKPQTPPV